ncbi:unnamed protein product [marine sediment metagenome]|uniref:Uncharacterized protein n=1 Tax=marine sediment metagenome TaxID=412755 RepID=X0U312_9ZZZZ
MTKTNMRRSGKPLKSAKKGPVKARRLRRRRKLKFAPPAKARVHGAVASGTRGKGPPVRNVVLAETTTGGLCAKCPWNSRSASTLVTWDYWFRGEWRRARRARCDKHARSLKNQVEKARPQGSS